MRAQDDTEYDREHLAHLIDIPAATLTIDGNFPGKSVTAPANEDGRSLRYLNSGVASAFANALAKQQAAIGDARFHFRPQVNMVAQYNFYATFTDSFAQLQKFNGGSIPANEVAFGVQITIPFFDKERAAKARESIANASHAFHDAENAQLEALDGQAHMRHTLDEISAQANVATLQQQYAQQQLDVLRLQLQSGTGDPSGPQMTPADEQKARIAERDKYLGVVDADFQLHQAEIQILRQTGGLEDWLKSSSTAPPPAARH
jgi:hypothetical protein